MKLIKFLSIASLLIPISFVSAQGIFGGDQGIGGPCSSAGGISGEIDAFEDVLCVMDTIADWMFTLLLALSTIFFLYAAFLYMNSGNEPSNLEKARHQLLYGAIALAIGMLSKGIAFVIAELLGAKL